jgi:hypothetical protein
VKHFPLSLCALPLVMVDSWATRTGLNIIPVHRRSAVLHGSDRSASQARQRSRDPTRLEKVCKSRPFYRLIVDGCRTRQAKPEKRKYSQWLNH